MQVVVVGCGLIGAFTAYELSQIPDLTISVFDYQPPAQASTGAALGVLMGIISQKVKGKAWKMRQSSIQRYETLIPELATLTEQPLWVNRQGILKLCFEEERDLEGWQTLIDWRRQQGWCLERWDRERIRDRCPQIAHPAVVAGIYSPSDRQLDPTALTLALVQAAQRRGVQFHWDTRVEPLPCLPEAYGMASCPTLSTSRGSIPADWIVLAAGIGSTALTHQAPQPLDIRPVVGQALRLQLDHPLGDPTFQPVITGQDIHIVPVAQHNYWIGATVEFPSESGEVTANPELLDQVLEGAIALCPALAQGKIVHSWVGRRPRPHNRPAPVVEPLSGYRNVLVATGHYRNGILLAPATAAMVKDWIVAGSVS